MKKWDAIICTWLDATGTRENHVSDEYVASYIPMVRRTIGFYLHRDERGVFITETDDRKATLSEDCENITVIPTSMLLQIDELSVLRSISTILQPGKPRKRSQ